jgi:hypothetical protein
MRDYEASVESCKAAQKPLPEIELDTKEQRLVNACHYGMQFLHVRITESGWRGSLNFVREYVRCASQETFTNTLWRPIIWKALLRQHPEWGRYIEVHGDDIRWR